jgi:glycerol-3-phosphate acyltransferase PlsY
MIPFSYLLGILKGVDIRKIGSGNIGATNLGRACGTFYFISGFALDGLKGLIPVMITLAIGLPAAVCGAGAIIGHVFNPFFAFRGGKGVSTTIGVTLGIVPKSFLAALAVWVIIYLITHIVALASICFAIVLPVIVFLWHESTILDRLFIVLMAVLIVYAHRSNIKRILNKEEPRTRLWRT